MLVDMNNLYVLVHKRQIENDDIPLKSLVIMFELNMILCSEAVLFFTRFGDSAFGDSVTRARVYRAPLGLCLIVIKMNGESIEVLFKQNLCIVKDFVQLMFDSLKKDVDLLKGENFELKRSLEFTQAELVDAKKETSAQSEKLRRLQEDGCDKGNLSERLRQLEDYSRRENVIVDGLDESSDENKETLQVQVQDILSNKLNINPVVVDVHRLGKNIKGKSRPVIVKLASFEERQKCLKFAPRLKGSNLYINKDVSKATHEIRKLKMHELKEKRKQGLIAYFSGIQLIVKKRTIAAMTPWKISRTTEPKEKETKQAIEVVAAANNKD